MTEPGRFDIRYYDRAGAPLDRDVWWEKLHDPDYTNLALDRVPARPPYLGDQLVYTRWLGIAASWEATALLFVTTVFRVHRDGAPAESVYWRGTEEEALALHQRLVAKLKRGRG